MLNSDCFILSSLWEDPGFVILEAALSNTFIISSNCPNGPNEILFNGRNGFLFQNNNLSGLLNKFDEFKKLNEDELNKKKLFAKKEIKMFTQFAHFKSLKNILETRGVPDYPRISVNPKIRGKIGQNSDIRIRGFQISKSVKIRKSADFKSVQIRIILIRRISDLSRRIFTDFRRICADFRGVFGPIFCKKIMKITKNLT